MLIFGKVLPNRWASLLLTVILIAIYTILVGGDPPVIRAAIMGGMGLFGRQIGRRQSGANSLIFVAALMCLGNPCLLGDAGFQLSFMATLGLILYGDSLSAGFKSLAGRCLPESAVNKITGPVMEYFLLTIAAQITTFPVIVYHFHRFSISSFIANILILPAQTPLMVLGGLSVLVGHFIMPLGQLLAYFAWIPLVYTIKFVELIARLWEGVITTGDVNPWLIILYYAAILSPILFKKFVKNLRRWIKPSGILLVLGVLTILVWREALHRPDGMLHLTLLDSGGGPAFFLQAPEGGKVLINGSSSANQLGQELNRRQSLFNRRLDFVILTRDEPPLAGLPEILERFPAQHIMSSSNIPDNFHTRRLVSVLDSQGAQVHTIQTGDQLELGGDAVLRVLMETDEGTALVLEMDRFRTLIPGGVSHAQLKKQAGKDLSNISFLVLDRKDLENSTIADWLSINPLAAIWYEEKLQLSLPENHARISTAEHGWIEITTDGQKLWLEAER